MSLYIYIFFFKNIVVFFLKVFFTFTKSVDHNEHNEHNAAISSGPSMFAKSTSLGISRIQRVNKSSPEFSDCHDLRSMSVFQSTNKLKYKFPISCLIIIKKGVFQRELFAFYLDWPPSN